MSGKLSKIENWETLARGAGYRPSMMAALCAVSLRQLERFFVDRFGATPGKWTRELRIQAARDRISEGLSNKEVVDELRFANASHLCHEFKRAFGTSPQSFAPLSEMRATVRGPNFARSGNSCRSFGNLKWQQKVPISGRSVTTE